MKKILKFVFCTMLVFLLTCTLVFAVETTSSETEMTTQTTETTVPITETTIPITETTAATTEALGVNVFGITVSDTEINTAIRCLVTILICFICLGIVLKKLSAIKDEIKTVQNKQDDLNGDQKATINGVNNLIDGIVDLSAKEKAALSELADRYAKIKKDCDILLERCAKIQTNYEKYGEGEDGRNRVTGVLLEQGAAILEILQFAYANSSKLPQGIKDMINLKYANALKTLSDDEQLLKLVATVRQSINAETDERRKDE